MQERIIRPEDDITSTISTKATEPGFWNDEEYQKKLKDYKEKTSEGEFKQD